MISPWTNWDLLDIRNPRFAAIFVLINFQEMYFIFTHLVFEHMENEMLTNLAKIYQFVVIKILVSWITIYHMGNGLLKSEI